MILAQKRLFSAASDEAKVVGWLVLQALAIMIWRFGWNTWALQGRKSDLFSKFKA